MATTAKLDSSRIVMRRVQELIPYANNPRTHTDEQVAQIAASIREFGFLVPVVVHGADIVAGHGRVAAARKLGMEEVPCIDASYLTDAQRRAYVIADNRLAQNAGWDEGLLRVELAGLEALDFDLDLLGFDTKELDKLLQPDPVDGLTDPDEVPEDVEAVTQAGDLWVLGEHRLLCGDATKAEDVERVLDGAKPFIMVTDPPYGVNYEPEWREGARRIGKVNNDDRADWSPAWALAPADVVYCWSSGMTPLVASGAALLATGFEIRASVVWKKPHFPISRGHYTFQHEPCWYAVRKSATAKWSGDRTQSTVWEVSLDKNVEGGHSTQKPVECMERPIRNHGTREDAVYDPFLGSGTTLIAAERQQRKGYFIEIDPHYVDVAVRRWENYTGRKAERVGKP